MYELTLAPDAREFFLSADAPLRKKLARCFEQLRSDPHHHPNMKPLKGGFKGFSRYRVGDYRVIFRISEDEQRVYVSEIAHRRDVYE